MIGEKKRVRESVFKLVQKEGYINFLIHIIKHIESIRMIKKEQKNEILKLSIFLNIC